MQNIVTGQTAIPKGDTDLLPKTFTEGKIEISVLLLFDSESSWQHGEDIFSTKYVFKYKYVYLGKP